MDLYEMYAADTAKEENGTWMEIGDSKFLVARSGNKSYVKMFTKQYERNKRALDRKDEAADKLAEKIVIDVMASTILLGWENVVFKGDTLDYTKDNAKLLLAMPEFRKQIQEFAEDFSEFKAVREEEEEKN